MLFRRFVLKTARHIHSVRNKSQAPRDLIYENLEGSDKGIVVFGLNRPHQKNALSANLIDELSKSLQRISVDSEARVLVIRSLHRGVFCAGADLKERLSMLEAEIAPFVTTFRNNLQRLHNSELPVIAALDGIALGGGLEVSLACDLRVASSDAKLGLVETKLAIIPGAGGTQRLPRLINAAVAKELIYTGRIIDGATAHQLGLVNHVVPQNDAGDAAYLKSLDLAREMLHNGPVALRMAKKAINKGLEVDLSTGLQIEEVCYAQVVPTSDRVEGLEAFTQKRKPKYTGR